MEAVSILVIIIIIYLIYNFISSHNQNTPLTQHTKQQTDKQANKQRTDKQRTDKQANKQRTDKQANIVPQYQRGNNQQTIPRSSVVPYDAFLDSNNNFYSSDDDSTLNAASPKPADNNESYDIMDRDILSKAGRDTIQGFRTPKTSTNELYWLSGGSLY